MWFTFRARLLERLTTFADQHVKSQQPTAASMWNVNHEMRQK